MKLARVGGARARRRQDSHPEWRRRAVLGIVPWLVLVGSVWAEPVEITQRPVPLNPSDATQLRVGALSFRGGLELESPDHRFGGLSGLLVSDDGTQLTAVTDQGRWLSAQLLYDADGMLAGIDGAEMGPLLDLGGGLLHGKQHQDAEDLCRLPDGSVLVSFERRHRLWRYRDLRSSEARPTVWATPEELLRAPVNGGLESVTMLQDGRVLLLTETWAEGSTIRGWVGGDGHWAALGYRFDGRPRPAGAALLPSGDVLVLERAYIPIAGNILRVMRIPGAEVVPGAVLEGEVLAELRLPQSVDNFEGIACRREAEGRSLIYLLSDDNFNPTQRTLLLVFALEEAGEGG